MSDPSEALGKYAAELSQLRKALEHGRSDVNYDAKRRLEKLSLAGMRVMAILHMAPKAYQDMANAAMGEFMLEVNKQSGDDSLAVEMSEYVLIAAVDMLAKRDEVLKQINSKVQDLAISRDGLTSTLADAENMLRIERNRVAELQGQLRRHCEHRQHHEHVRERVWAATGGKCFYCSVDLVKESGLPESFEVDHIVPKNSGGPDHLANFVPACAKCNGEKSDKPFVEFVSKQATKPMLRVVGGGDGQ